MEIIAIRHSSLMDKISEHANDIALFIKANIVDSKSHNDIRQKLISDIAYHIIFKDNDEIIGYAAISNKSTHKALNSAKQIEYLIVKATERRNMHGTRLFNQLFNAYSDYELYIKVPVEFAEFGEKLSSIFNFKKNAKLSGKKQTIYTYNI
jgi:hypothetical protein